MAENMQALEAAVKRKLKDYPRLIMRLREEEDERVFYRVFWEDNTKPSTVISVVWDGRAVKWLNEAYSPMKDGVPLGGR